MTTNDASSLPTEEYLVEVMDALTFVMEKKVSGDRLSMTCAIARLDALKRIQDATELKVVFREMRRYLDDAHVCLVCLQSLLMIIMNQEDLEDSVVLK
jgi:hypothetical protein